MWGKSESNETLRYQTGRNVKKNVWLHIFIRNNQKASFNTSKNKLNKESNNVFSNPSYIKLNREKHWYLENFLQVYKKNDVINFYYHFWGLNNKEIEDLNRKLLNVNTIPDDVLLNISSERFDWEKISIKVGFVYEFLLFN